MSGFNRTIESKSSERSNGASDDSVDNQADKTIYHLLRQLNRSNAAKIPTDQSTQQSSIRDLLAYDK